MLGIEDFAKLREGRDEEIEFMTCGCSCPISAFSPAVEPETGIVFALVCIQCHTVYHLKDGKLDMGLRQ